MPYAQKMDANLILTTGVVLDLVVTGYATEILLTLPTQIHFPKQVYEDYSFHLEKLKQRNRNTDSLEPLMSLLKFDGVTLVDLETEAEYSDFNDCTADIRFPKQRLGAIVRIIAKQRQWIVACNDLYTMYSLDELNPKGQYLSCIDLVKYWFDAKKIKETEQFKVIERLKNSSIAPANGHPAREWWNQKLKILEEGQ